MEIAFRAALIAWLANDPALSAGLNAVVEEAPLRTALPWLALTASASTDWSTKTATGREVRLALELVRRGMGWTVVDFLTATGLDPAQMVALELHELAEKVMSTCSRMKVDKLLIENKAAGHSVAQEVRRLMASEDFGVQMYDPKTLDKMARLYAVQHIFAEGMVYAPDRAWADQVITQVAAFPKAKHDDLVDTVSQSLRHLRDLGLLTRGPEWTAAIEDSMVYGGKSPAPLYPA